MPAKVVPGADAVRKATEANLAACAENVAAGGKLIEELSQMSALMRRPDASQ